jgi:hypothetical protein
MRIFALAILLLTCTSPVFAEEGWEEVKDTLYEGKEVVLLPLQSERYYESLGDQPPPQPELHFSGAQGDGISLAQAMLLLPPLSDGERSVEAKPFFALRGQDDGTRQGKSLTGEGGVILSLGGRIQAKVAWERTIRPFPLNTFMVNASFYF